MLVSVDLISAPDPVTSPASERSPSIKRHRISYVNWLRRPCQYIRHDLASLLLVIFEVGANVVRSNTERSRIFVRLRQSVVSSGEEERLSVIICSSNCSHKTFTSAFINRTSISTYAVFKEVLFLSIDASGPTM